jgi:uridylate kinase
MKIVFSIGGSIVAPEEVDRGFVEKLASLLRDVSAKNKIAVVVGGGRPARKKIEEARKKGLNEAACDLIGIDISRLNAVEVSRAFGGWAVKEPPKTIVEAAEVFNSRRVLFMGGTEPGHSTDGVAAILAELVGADLIVNASNVDFVYDEDPKRNPNAKPLEKILASDLVKLVAGGSMKAGGYALVDLTAAKIIERSRIKTIFLNGRDLENMRAAVEGKTFKGTTVN